MLTPCCAAVIAIGAAFAQIPGELPSDSAQAELRALAGELAAQMNAGDRSGVATTVEKIHVTLGGFAGVPESPERYVTPLDRSAPEVDRVEAAVAEAMQTVQDRLGAASELARANQTELREHAYLALAALALGNARSDLRDDMIAVARRELDYLLARQGDDGLFPYPADPGGRAPENVRRQVERAKKEHPEALRNGYMYLSVPDMQFDVGCSGVALCAGYAATNDSRYRAAAEKAAQWALAIPMSWNWNYNAFSVWLLANVYKITGDDKYLDGAVHKAQLGVLPGLMENGRWVDQHNAKQSYHFIMVRALSDLLSVLPKDHPFRDELDAKLALAVDSRVEDILRDGVSNFSSAIWGLSTTLKNQPPTPQRWDAANAIANAILDHDNAPGDKLMLAFYLAARKRR